MAESGKTANGRKSDYVDIKSLFKPSVIILLAVAVLLSFVAVKFTVDGVFLKESAALLKGQSILGESDYTITADDNPEVEDMGQLSTSLSMLNATHTEWTNIEEDSSQNGFFCIATEIADRRIVYRLDTENICGKGYKLSDFKYIWVDAVNDGFYTVINIPGEVVDLSGYYILVRDDTGNLASRLVINCYEAKVVKLKSTILTGTLLAPKANVEYDATSVYGQVYAMAATGTRAFYKEIAFGGYSKLLTEVYDVEFKDSRVRDIAFAQLKTEQPALYSEFPDDYKLNSLDLAYITRMTFNGSSFTEVPEDLVHFMNLKSLSLYSTAIETVDISALPSLAELTVTGGVKEIVVSPENNLKKLVADNSLLETLDTSLLAGLTELSVANVNFKTWPDLTKLTSLKKLDISGTGFRAFSEAELAVIAPKLTALSVASNEGVTSFDIKPFASLEFLNLNDCKLSSLDLTGATTLEILYCSRTNISKIDTAPAVNLKIFELYRS